MDLVSTFDFQDCCIIVVFVFRISPLLDNYRLNSLASLIIQLEKAYSY
jgi:hypothetical protein